MQRIILSVTLLVGMAACQAWAQIPGQISGKNLGQTTGQDQSQDPTAQATARLLEEPESVTVSVFVLGRVEVKEHTVSISVKSAREANGAGLKELIGKSLKVTGEKIQRLEQMNGKMVELRGRVTDYTEFDVHSYTERRTVTAAESARVQGARGPVGNPVGAINAKGPSERPSASGNRTPIEALNDPRGAGVNKPNTGVIGTLRGRAKPMQPDITPDFNLPAAAAAAGVLR